MLPEASMAVSELIAHAHHQPELLRELSLDVTRALNKPGATIALKQLALIAVLEELSKLYPADFQMRNLMSVMVTQLVGLRLLTAVSAAPPPEESDA